MQFVVNPFKYLHKLDWAVTVQAAEFADESETVTRIIIVPKIFQTVAIIARVEEHIARSIFILVKRVQKIPAYLKWKRNKMLEYSHPFIRGL